MPCAGRYDRPPVDTAADRLSDSHPQPTVQGCGFRRSLCGAPAGTAMVALTLLFVASLSKPLRLIFTVPVTFWPGQALCENVCTVFLSTALNVTFVWAGLMP